MGFNVIDIGKDQWGMNIAAVACDAVIVAVCDAYTNNPYADRQYQAAKAAGRRLGVYQYYHNDPAEADYFMAQTKGYVGQAVFIVDAETDGGPGMVTAVLQACNRILTGHGVRPLVYIPVWLLNKYNWSPLVTAGYALWLPAYVLGSQPIYGFNPPNGLLPPKWWRSCAMWQFTSTGRLPGYGGDLDLSIFAGDGKAWDAYAALVATQSTTVTPIQEDALSASDVAAINAHTDAVAADIKNYLAALVVNGWSNGTGAHKGVAIVAEANQASLAALAKAAPAPVLLTDAQLQQVLAAVPPATMAALKTQINK